jgi:hypothetical protein
MTCSPCCPRIGSRPQQSDRSYRSYGNSHASLLPAGLLRAVKRAPGATLTSVQGAWWQQLHDGYTRVCVWLATTAPQLKTPPPALAPAALVLASDPSPTAESRMIRARNITCCGVEPARIHSSRRSASVSASEQPANFCAISGYPAGYALMTTYLWDTTLSSPASLVGAAIGA